MAKLTLGQLREKTGLDLNNYSEAVGICPVRLMNIENGSQVAKAEEIIRIADYHHIGIESQIET